MAHEPRPSVADVLERCAAQMHSVAFDFREPSESIEHSDARIGAIERIVAAALASVRGASVA